MTTDTFPKGAVAHGRRSTGVPVTIAGIAKGSGMIAPDMATMLAFVVTDAALPARCCSRCCARRPTLRSTRSRSTATPRPPTRCCCSPPGRRGNAPRDRRAEPRLADFRRALDRAAARSGASRSCATARARRSSSRSPSRAPRATPRRGAIGLAIANSPLVKTAIAGGDANWGRVVMAVGKSGEPGRSRPAGVAFGGNEVARDGAAVPELDEAPVAAHLTGREIEIGVGGRRRAGQGHGLDLRSHPRLHRRSMPTTGPEPGHLPLLLVAACALVDPDGRVLVAQRPPGKPMAGLWEFPGRQGATRARRPKPA